MKILNITVLSFLIHFAAPMKVCLYLADQGFESDMQAKGMKLTAEDIYSVNNASIKDAIFQFGGDVHLNWFQIKAYC